MKSAVFLDRDGTVNVDVGHLDRLERLTLFPFAIDAVRLLNQAGFQVVVVTNQGGVAAGMVEESFVVELHELLQRRFEAGGATIAGIYYCPHDPAALVPAYRTTCDCRKPAAGMLRRAAAELDLDLSRSYMVGDKWSDVAVAEQVGATGMLVRTGYGVTQEAQAGRPADALVVDDLMAATVHILERGQGGSH
ncbi:MAG: HAD family hydrolase [Acidobacteria bacterium]|nr:HAD family hydrolase [Acidobacteriota bacterium]